MMSDGDWFLVKCVVASLIIPTISFFAIRQTRRGPRPVAAKVAAWLCLWIGQASFVMAFAVYIAAYFGYAWWQTGHVLQALVFGVGAAGLSLLLTLLAIRVFVLGTLSLAQQSDDLVSAASRKLRVQGLVALAFAVLHWVALFNISLPGGWEVLAYFIFVSIPLAFSALLVAMIGIALVGPPWRAPLV